jgi:lipoprotein-anchoring transpeptidase ErfK/SrfK
MGSPNSRRRRSLVACVAALLLPAVAPASSSSARTVQLPAAGVLLTSRAVVRAAPRGTARAVRVLHRLRPDGQFLVVLAIATRRDADGRRWYRLSLPGRPNGQRGWIRGELLDLHTTANRIVVRVGERRIYVRRVADGHVLISGVVAVGKPGAETPLGRDFYVQGRFFPRDPFFGRFVLETSAYSKLSDWPGGGLAGIHGTNEPQLLGRAVSHGCVRVSDRVARALERLAPLGTPIDLMP